MKNDNKNERDFIELMPITPGGYEYSKEITKSPIGNADWIELDDQLRSFFNLFHYEKTTQYRSRNNNNRLYLKPAFILNWTEGNSPSSRKDYQEAAVLLLADRSALFSYEFGNLQHNRINKRPIKRMKGLYKSPKTAHKCFSDWILPTVQCVFQKDDLNIARKLLDAMYDTAKSQHKPVENWIKYNIGLWPESDFEKPNQDQLVNAKLLFSSLLNEEEPLSDEFCKEFILRILNDYCREWKRLHKTKGGILVAKPRDERIYEYREMKERVQHMHALLEGYSKDEGTPFNASKYEVLVPHQPEEKYAAPIPEIRTAIISFFENCKTPLSIDLEGQNMMDRRISGALRSVWSGQEKTLLPIVLFYMTGCCGRKITEGEDVDDQNPPFFRLRAERDSVLERMAQIKLVRQLCEIFEKERLPCPQDTIKNWNQFFSWQGKEIRSTEEALWWKEYGIDMDALPKIGFQLCCAERLEKCITIGETLYSVSAPRSYNPIEWLPVESQQAVEAYMDRQKESKKRYFKLWNTVGIPRSEMIEQVDAIYADVFQENTPESRRICELLHTLSNKEDRRIAFEKAIRTRIVKQAKVKLAEKVRSAFLFSEGFLREE